MKSKLSLLAILFGLLISACTQKENKCIITGKVIDRPQSAQLRLTKSFEDFRSESVILIPIVDNAFTYEMEFENMEAYTLVFEDEYYEGIMRSITFFPTNDTIVMELYPMEEFSKNSIRGGKENKQFTEYEKKKMDEVIEKTQHIKDSLEILERNDEFYSPVIKILYEQLDNTEKEEEESKIHQQINELYKSNEGFTPAARKLIAQRDSISKIIEEKELEFLKNNISIPKYFMLIRSLQISEYLPHIFDFNELQRLQKRYTEKYKNHPYTDYSNEIIWRLANIKPEGNYYDFTLPDLDGKEYKISEEIKEKYAFITIWAPWCGSCLRKNYEAKPLFEKYKNKDFIVIGVASKYQGIADVEKQLEKDKYPWITLIDEPELDSKINQHYGTEMAGGGCFLIDKEGKIVLVNPSIKEVEEVLEANL